MTHKSGTGWTTIPYADVEPAFWYRLLLWSTDQNDTACDSDILTPNHDHNWCHKGRAAWWAQVHRYVAF